METSDFKSRHKYGLTLSQKNDFKAKFSGSSVSVSSNSNEFQLFLRNWNSYLAVVDSTVNCFVFLWVIWHYLLSTECNSKSSNSSNKSQQNWLWCNRLNKKCQLPDDDNESDMWRVSSDIFCRTASLTLFQQS